MKDKRKQEENNQNEENKETTGNVVDSDALYG